MSDDTRFAIQVNGMTGELDVSATPSCVLGGTRYEISARKLGGSPWHAQFDCDVAAPDGTRASGSASQREGGAFVIRNGPHWGVETPDGRVYRLGAEITVTRDPDRRTLVVSPEVPPEDVPFVIAGLVLIVHPDS